MSNNLSTLSVDEAHVDVLPVKRTTKSISVLLIENKSIQSRMFVETVQRQQSVKIKTRCCDDLESALKYLSVKLPDIILLNLCLPDADGVNALSALRTTVPYCPIIVISDFDNSEFALRAIKAGAQDFLIKSSTNPDHILKAIQFAIERKKAELPVDSSCVEQELVFRELMAQAPVSMIRLRTDFSISDFNNIFAEDVNLNVGEINKKSVWDLFPMLPEVLIRNAFQSGVPFKADKTTRINNRFYDIVGWPVRAKNLEVKELVLLVVDVTEKVSLEKQQDDFLASLAHDIKTPISGQSRIFDAMLEGMAGQLSSRHAEIVSALKESNVNLLSLLQNLLDVYRYEASAVALFFESLNLNELVRKQQKLLSPFAKLQNVQIELQLSEELQDLSIDHVAVERLIANLLHNALKFSKKDGKVTISTVKNDHEVIVSISDTGLGIPVDEQPFLFRRFAQGAASRKYRGGSGLGLYLCKQIVQAHGGEISCATTPDVGSTFTFTIPLNRN